MPRPGPRPYECVRRAWHSDRHQPMRGSIIRQIFKVVYETHSAVTRKNKEWQDKLPIVVLKAEEIMYSKANSEAEYMDGETLWDRVNDAIDTIIRKDEGAETGEFLPPCVEVRASRSQRHSNPRNYLGPRTQESGSAASKFSCGNSNERNINLLPPYSGNQSNLERSTTCSFVPLVSESNQQSVPNFSNPTASSYQKLNFPVGDKMTWKESNASFNLGSVYPLYYGTNFQPEISKLGFQEPHVSKDIIIGTPIFASVEKPTEIGCTRTLLPGEGNEIVPNRTKQSEFAEETTVGCEGDCDLSLRLGLFSNSIFCRGKGTANDSFDPHGNSQEVGKSKAISSSRDKDFSLFSAETTVANDSSMLRLGRNNNLESEDQNAEAFLRKRKLPFHSNVDSSRQRFGPVNPSPTTHHFYDQGKRQSS